MADFCKQCEVELFGKQIDSVVHDIADNEFLLLLCEGCGRYVRVAKDGHRTECGTCADGDDGVCQHAGEISTGFCCEKYQRRL